MNKNIAIRAENISKQYRLGEVGTGTISHDLNRFWARVRGKEDPFLKIGESNDRTKKGDSDYVWSLKDINFEIEKGDAVGIIGRNGAGKSTLLKLLSRVTKPTTGHFEVQGRIASLLEVGTGFNPEMTGRENIFLNGAILGMRRHEIKRKFDEIVDFAGVERYIDTPVKRYSSGMYVRLAFAVAAHLESEILIVDEVLAVGDAEFQKKCLGKMGDVSKGEGRTVLFVSHDMRAVNRLCKNAISLLNGKIHEYSRTSDVITQYLQLNQHAVSKGSVHFAIPNSNLEITDVNFMQNGLKRDTLQQGRPFSIAVKMINNSENISHIEFNFELKNAFGEYISCFGNEFQNKGILVKTGENFIEFQFEELTLREGKYYIDVFTNTLPENKSYYLQEALAIKIEKVEADYFINSNRLWNHFPHRIQHGYFPIKFLTIKQW